MHPGPAPARGETAQPDARALAAPDREHVVLADPPGPDDHHGDFRTDGEPPAPELRREIEGPMRQTRSGRFQSTMPAACDERRVLFEWTSRALTLDEDVGVHRAVDHERSDSGVSTGETEHPLHRGCDRTEHVGRRAGDGHPI